ncbi:N-methyl-L-tryptophan oxidase [Paenibacillus aurantiacus]|uniref:N-methyl-L-tryptophan oxidase n=1 Tax=Paenibacillus aurantiacus TaxID=1936118 RepID=A0ABV5KVY1_9BACL
MSRADGDYGFTAGERVYDVIVVGAGSMGMSAGYQLAKRGARVLLLDAFDPPHGEGSHHGETRLIRHAYSGGDAYVRLALRAQQLWEEAEALTGERLLAKSGVLNLADPDVHSHRGRYWDAVRLGVSVEMLDAADIRRRWPGLALPDRFEALYEPDAGYLFSERCVAAYRKLALANGAKLLTGTPVIGVTARAGRASVHTPHGDYHAGAAVLCAGAWFGGLADFLPLPIRPLRKVVGWFETSGDDYREGTLPGFTMATAGGVYYGFPDIAGMGLKIGRHDGGHPWRPGEPLAPFGRYAEDEGDLRGALGTFMPGAAGRLLRGSACKYAMTPDEHFIIDRHPEHPHVLIAGGFSGHGFKFASAVGELLAEMADGAADGAEINLFALSRFNPAPAPVHDH